MYEATQNNGIPLAIVLAILILFMIGLLKLGVILPYITNRQVIFRIWVLPFLFHILVFAWFPFQALRIWMHKE